MSQQERILNLLQQGPVCVTTWRVEIPRMAARIGELKGKGYRIGARPCGRRVHGHLSARQIEYFLEPKETLF